MGYSTITPTDNKTARINDILKHNSVTAEYLVYVTDNVKVGTSNKLKKLGILGLIDRA